MKALSGRGRAKTWVREQGGYWVTFPRLVDVVKQQMMTEHAEVYDEASSAPALIVPIPDVPNVSARLEVVGAKATDTFVLQLADETRLLEPLSFKGKAFGFEAPPGDYDAILRHDATTLARNEPPPGDRIAFYEGNEPHLVFVAAPRPRRGKAPRAAEPATGALFLPNVGTATAHFRVHRQGDGDVVNVIPQARSLERPPGNYKVNLMERGEQIGSATVQIGPGEDVILEPAEMLQPSAVLVAVSRRPAKGHFPSLLADDLLGQLDPAAATSVIDPNPALILALVGTAAIIDTPPYRGAVGKLETFDDLAQGSSAVYVMVDDALVGAVAVGPGQRHALDAVEGLAGARHARINVAPGPHDLHVHLDDQPDILLATHAFPGRVTLITLGAGTPPAIRQFALIPGGMVGGVTDPDALAAARFAELVQRRFGDDRVVAADLEADDQVRWEAISAGDWPEPLTAVLAGYELVRRGALANRPEAIRSLVDRLANLVGPLTDLAVLANLAAGTPPPQEGTPLVSDGVVASGARRRDGFVPNERCGWTVWQRWG